MWLLSTVNNLAHIFVLLLACEIEVLEELRIALDRCFRFWPVSPKFPLVEWEWPGRLVKLVVLVQETVWELVLGVDKVVVMVAALGDNPLTIWLAAAVAAAAFNRELWALIAVSVAYCISRADTDDLKTVIENYYKLSYKKHRSITCKSCCTHRETIIYKRYLLKLHLPKP